MAGFDVKGARAAGYSDDEILQHLTRSRKFDVSGALNSGYSKQDVIDHLSGTASQSVPGMEQLGGTPPQPPSAFGRVDYPQNRGFAGSVEYRPPGTEPQEVTEHRKYRNNTQGSEELGGAMTAVGGPALVRGLATAPVRTALGFAAGSGADYGLRKLGLPAPFPEIGGMAVGGVVGGIDARNALRSGVRGLFSLSGDSLPIGEMKAAVRGGRMSLEDFTNSLIKSGRSKEDANLIAGNLKATMEPKQPLALDPPPPLALDPPPSYGHAPFGSSGDPLPPPPAPRPAPQPLFGHAPVGTTGDPLPPLPPPPVSRPTFGHAPMGTTGDVLPPPPAPTAVPTSTTGYAPFGSTGERVPTATTATRTAPLKLTPPPDIPAPGSLTAGFSARTLQQMKELGITEQELTDPKIAQQVKQLDIANRKALQKPPK